MTLTSIDTRRQFRTVTASQPCPICRRPDWCRVSTDGDIALCRRVNDGTAKVRQYKDGGEYYCYRLHGAATPGPLPEATVVPAAEAQRADPETLHRVYSALLDQLPLQQHHVQELRGRGLPGNLRDAGYRGLPLEGRAQLAGQLIDLGLEQHFPFVPGFRLKEGNHCPPFWSLCGSPGLVIPVRDAAGQIRALSLRPDEQRAGRKYIYLSSRKHGGPGPGSPIHVPLFAGDKTTVRVTEGALKANVATALSGMLTIGLPGISAIHRAAKVLRYLGAMTVRLAFDADARQNPNVASALKRLAKELRDDGFVVELEIWDLADGKGIDDLLHNGGTPTVVTGADVFTEIETIVNTARATIPIPPTALASHHPPEAPTLVSPVSGAIDDPHRLARLFLADHMANGLLTLRYWREQWYRWDGAWRLFPEDELRGVLSQRIKRDFDEQWQRALSAWQQADGVNENGKNVRPPVACKVTARLIADVANAALLGLALLSASVTAPAWTNGAGPFPADEVLACHNTLVHLPSWAEAKPALHPLTPAFFSTNALDYDFRLTAEPPAAWLAFLQQLWPNDPPSIEALQEWFGYCLLPDTSQQKILLLVGPKRCGKGTIARILRATIGEANVAAPTLASLGLPFGLQSLLGKTLGLIADARLSGRTDIAVVVERLLSISGEDAQTIDRKYLSPVTTQLPTRFMILTNELPRLSDASGALAGRFILLRLTKSWYGSEDTHLTGRLKKELPAILLWALDGWKRLRARGRFVQPPSSASLVEDLEDLASPIHAFVKECCECGAGYEVFVPDLYTAWQTWCEAKGRKEAGTEQTFGRDLRAAVPALDDGQRRVGGTRVRMYTRASACGKRIVRMKRL